MRLWFLALLPWCTCGVENNACRTLHGYNARSEDCWLNPDFGASTEEIIRFHGYPFESYSVTTQDGYILSLFRIPQNKTFLNGTKAPILFQAGITVDSQSWFVLGSNSPVFQVVNNGYDVWLANNRGTPYSKKNVNLSIFEPQYWNYSFHELGVYDLSAILDFITNAVQKKVIIISHSMGTTLSFVYASLKPAMAADKIEKLIALSPVAFAKHMSEIYQGLSKLRHQLWELFVQYNLYSIGPNTPDLVNLFRFSCTHYPSILTCHVLTRELTGTDVKPAVFPMFMNTLLAGVSIKTVFHFGQLISNENSFCKFDYGPENNVQVYNRTTPPSYPLKYIKIPIVLFYGTNDTLSVGQDVRRLYQTLRTWKAIKEFPDYGHLDFYGTSKAHRVFEILLENYL